MHYYKILKHKAGFDEGTNYWEKILARYLAATGGSKIHTTLPITFTSTSWKLVSWTIYGNNTPNNYSTEDTLPLTFTTQTAGNADDWSIEGNNNAGKNLLEITAETRTINGVTFTVDKTAGTITANGAASRYTAFSLGTVEAENGMLLSGCEGGSSSTYWIDTYDRTRQYVCYTGDTVIGYTGSTNPRIVIRQDAICNNLVFKPMLRPANTSSDFEPYQVGVGERTKNYAKVETGATEAGVTFTFDPVAGTVTANGTATRDAQCKVYFNNPGQPNNSTVPPGNYYFSGCPSGGSGSKYDCYSWDYDTGERSKKWNGTTNVDSDFGQGNCQVKINGHKQGITIRIKSGYTANNVVFKPMLRAAGTSADFIPFGYKIPLNVNNTTQDIYIGTSPLTAGETVAKTSTGVDIAAIAGSNTITTELYNKPSMSIEGLDYVGVGERTKNLLEITAETQTVNGVKFTIDKLAGTITANGTASANARLDFHTTEMTVNATDIVNGIPSGATSSTYYILVEFENGTNAFGSNLDNTAIGDRPNFTPRVLGWRIYVISGQTVNNLVFKPMLRAADTDAEFIPYGYEVPILVSGENLFDKNATDIDKGYAQESYINSSGAVQRGNFVVTEYTSINTEKCIINWYIGTLQSSTVAGICFYDTSKTYISGVMYGKNASVTVNVPSGARYFRASIFAPTKNDASIYGSNEQDIYIGSAPLTEGQTVSDTTEIEVFEGENTIDTTLYNKPEMEITYE